MIKQIEQFLKNNSIEVGKLIRTARHISKVNNGTRKCFKCSETIVFDSKCVTQTYSLINRREKFQVSYHAYCYKNRNNK